MSQTATVTDLTNHSLVKTREIDYQHCQRRVQNAVNQSEQFTDVFARPVGVVFGYLHETSSFGTCALSFDAYETEDTGDISLAFYDRYDSIVFHPGNHYDVTFEDASEVETAECEFLWLETKLRTKADRLSRNLRTTPHLDEETFLSLLEAYVDERPEQCVSPWVQLPWVFLMFWSQSRTGILLSVDQIVHEGDPCLHAKVLTEHHEIDLIFNNPKLHRRYSALLERQRSS